MRNANGGESSGPLEIDRPWDGYTDDHISVMDHLGIDKFVKELARLQGDIGKLQNEISRLRAEIFEPEQGMDDGKSDLGKPVEGRLDELDRLAKKLERSFKLAHIALKTKLTSLDLKNHLDVLINLLDPQRINGLPFPNASEAKAYIGKRYSTSGTQCTQSYRREQDDRTRWRLWIRDNCHKYGWTRRGHQTRG